MKVSMADVRVEHEVKLGDFTLLRRAGVVVERKGWAPREVFQRGKIRRYWRWKWGGRGGCEKAGSGFHASIFGNEELIESPLCDEPKSRMPYMELA